MGPYARITEPNLPNGLVLAGWDGQGAGRAVAAALTATRPSSRRLEPRAGLSPRRRLGRHAATTNRGPPRPWPGSIRPRDAAWPQSRDELKQLWFDCYIGRALEPEKHFHDCSPSPDEQLSRTRDWWDAAAQEFQIRTPDRHLNALMNWARATTEYHRQGPGLVLGGQIWQMYSHISTGWYGKQWGGDHAAMEQCLRFYAAMQGDDGFIRWVSPSLVAFDAEDNTPYWVDQVWRHYTWTGDRRFVRDMWPLVRKAVAWQRTHNDPDGDGLFRDCYEYWNCDSNGKGPKAAAPSAMAWAMLDRAAPAGRRGRRREGRGRLSRGRPNRPGSKSSRELWREERDAWARSAATASGAAIRRPGKNTWPSTPGCSSPAQSRRAMRWIAAHYGFEPRPGVKLLSCSDWWPRALERAMGAHRRHLPGGPGRHRNAATPTCGGPSSAPAVRSAFRTE